MAFWDEAKIEGSQESTDRPPNSVQMGLVVKNDMCSESDAGTDGGM